MYQWRFETLTKKEAFPEDVKQLTKPENLETERGPTIYKLYELKQRTVYDFMWLCGVLLLLSLTFRMQRV